MKRLFVSLLSAVAFFALVSTGAVAAGDAVAPAAYLAKDAKVTILSTMLTDDDGIGEWGFAGLVEVDGYRVLREQPRS